MINWCTTTLHIYGENDDIVRFSETIGDDFDFARIIPMPNELKGTRADSHTEYEVYYGSGIDRQDIEKQRAELDLDPKNQERADYDKALLEKYGAYDWYDWCCENWGTEWSSENVDIDIMDDQITITFDTAWSFPEPIFRKLVEMFPEIDFDGHAVEPDMGFACIFRGENGNLRVASCRL